MQIVETKEVSFDKGARKGTALALANSMAKMKPGQSLIVDVDYSDLKGLSDEQLEEYAEEREIKTRPGESVHAAISRFIANRQRTRMMAALDKSLLPKHYYHTKLIAPGEDGLVRQLAIVCDEGGLKPARKPRTVKAKK